MIERENIDSFAFENLAFQYDEGGLVFENVTFEVPKHKAVWIRSPGGRGKSTLLKLMAGLLTSQRGKYLINGHNVNEMSFEDFLKFRFNIGYGFDMHGLLNNKSLSENLILPLQYHKMVTPEEAHARTEKVLETFGLHDSQNLRPFAATGSLRKLICVLRAFIHWPQIVILDDPLTGLKRDQLDDLYRFIDEGFSERGLKQIFFTSENPELAERYSADELLISYDWFTTRGSRHEEERAA